MKYKAIIETDDFEDFEFFEDGNGKYIRGIDAGAVNNEWIAVYFTECKQENVLDKIRAEIEAKIAEPQYQHEEEDWIVGLIMAETIIDRYKAESEGKDERSRR